MNAEVKPRRPRPELLREARAAATQHGTKLMLCFGGNGHGDPARARARAFANVLASVGRSRARET